jgi:hypothetical protein
MILRRKLRTRRDGHKGDGIFQRDQLDNVLVVTDNPADFACAKLL